MIVTVCRHVVLESYYERHGVPNNFASAAVDDKPNAASVSRPSAGVIEKTSCVSPPT
jgi:hypothetical protein